jgi:hypothetical protein
VSPEVERELTRRARVSDLMLTAHSVLRERYAWRSLAFDVGLFAVATVLAATTFLDPAILRLVGLDPETWRITIGLLSVAVFFFSIVGLRVDWKERSAQHQQAVKSLADIKAKARELLVAPADRSDAEVSEFLRASGFVTSELIPIPDAQFAALKARHHQKVELSRLVDSYPFAPQLILRWVFRWRDGRAALAKQGVRGPPAKE